MLVKGEKVSFAPFQKFAHWRKKRLKNIFPGTKLVSMTATLATLSCIRKKSRWRRKWTSGHGYTANGELTEKRQTIPNQPDAVTTYNYDVFGNLRNATLPDGTQLEYLIDSLNRRIGKKVNGTFTQGFLYFNQLEPIAELDGNGNIISTFIYADRAQVPSVMIKGGTTYRIIADHLGSVRLVIDTSTGNVVQQLDYDAFGNITQDTSPGFQPFAYAGGIYDPHTKLTRFGARDYDPQTGRWTAKDPIGFNGGNTNHYAYVENDPVNFIDPTGLAPGDPYPTSAAAATAGLDYARQQTPQFIEYGGWSYPHPTQSGKYTFTDLVRGNPSSVPGAKLEAIRPSNAVNEFHSHPDPVNRPYEEGTSDGDIASAKYTGLPEFIRLRDGRTRVLTPVDSNGDGKPDRVNERDYSPGVCPK